MKPEDRIGETIGIYTIVAIDRTIKNSNRIYVCKCNYCKNIFIRPYCQIKSSSICYHLNVNGQLKECRYTWENKKLKDIFNGMMRRCYNKNDKDYRWYGAKGIKICDKWINYPKSFEEWSISNGYVDGLTIDRIDCNKDYCPENCRWVTSEDNSRYKSTTRILTVNNESHTGREWADILGIGTNTINRYVRTYGKDDTEEFIKRFLNNPNIANKKQNNESMFDLYMS